MRRLFATVILLTVLLALVACGGAKPEPTAAPSAGQAAAATKAPAQAEAKPTAAATRAPQPTAAPAATEEALPILKAGALKSYVAKMEFKSEVVKPEAAVETWSEMEMTYRLDPAPVAYAMVLKDRTQPEQPDTEMIVIGADTYFKNSEDNTWMKFQSGGGLGDTMQAMLNPEELTKDAPVDVFTASNVVNRNETVDGVATTHYRATEAQLRAMLKETEASTQQTQKLLSGTADFWIAKKGNYLKQYRTEMLQEDEAGRQIKSTLQMLITQENRPVTIAPPPADQVTDLGGLDQETPEPAPTAEPPSAETSAALAALPAPPQSKEYKPSELTGGAQLMVQTMAAQAPVRAFLSDASPADVDKFYETKMQQLGYQSVMQTEGELGIVINMFTKGEQSVMIQIHQDAGSGKTLVIMQMP